MLKKILAILLVVVLAFGGFVGSRPSDYKIERSIVIDGPIESVYPEVVMFRRWGNWSPWAHLDPNMAVEYGGPKGGLGSTYHWKGNDKVGEGRMTMTGALKDELVQIKLEFIKPWAQVSQTEFRFKPEGPGQTRVTWTMTGKHDFVGKLFALFMDMDKMVGTDFEKGLAALKARGERDN
ncbi:MAG TPA: SRPBCC family protein [Anaeromyxobacteraceae bacterium]|nr:SRPBCC family protein [Anaeromyxobacteraceae bacterium]